MRSLPTPTATLPAPRARARQAIKCDPSDHVFYSNRSAAYLSMGDAEAALADGEKCVELSPAFAKGWGRVGAAQYKLGAYEEAAIAYSRGLQADPGSAALKEGLEEAKAAERREASRGGGGLGGGLGALFGPDLVSRLAANPKFAPYLADPAFVAKLQALQSNPQDLAGVMGGGAGGGAPDPRFLEVLSFLLGAQIRTPGGGGGGGWGDDGGGDDGGEAEAAAAERAALSGLNLAQDSEH